jgi:hypothetical protein
MLIEFYWGPKVGKLLQTDGKTVRLKFKFKNQIENYILYSTDQQL